MQRCKMLLILQFRLNDLINTDRNAALIEEATLLDHMSRDGPSQKLP